MKERALFDSAEDAVPVLWAMTMHLQELLTWALLWLLHLTLAVLVLLAFWLAQATPHDVLQAGRTAANTWPLSALAAIGASASTLVAGYWWLLRRVHRWVTKELLQRRLVQQL